MGGRRRHLMARKAGPPDLSQQIEDIAAASGGPVRTRWYRQNVFRPGRADPGGYTPEQYLTYRARRDMEQSSVLGVDATGRTVNPFAGMTSRPGPRQRRTMVDIFKTSDEYLEAVGPDGYTGVEYQNLAGANIDGYTVPGVERSHDAPVPLTVVPTSSTQPERPRTVAAGFEIKHGESLGQVTVVFRDGTYYNYFDVSAQEWEGFKAAASKGAFIARVLDGKPRGIADIGALDSRVRSLINIYRVARASQKWHYRPGTAAAAKAKSRSAHRQPKANKAATHPSYLGRTKPVPRSKRKRVS